MRVFLMGGTGQVGTRLLERMKGRGDEVVLLTRRVEAVRAQWGDWCQVVSGDPMEEGEWMTTAGESDAVINLVGENVFARRWNEEFKKLMRESRVRSTENAVKALAAKPTTAEGRAKVLVNASAIGYYGARNDEELTETSSPGEDVMATLCVDWEKAALAARDAGVRVAVLRIGVVLDKRGGALAKMLPVFRWFVGGPVGSGRQYVSWIHHQDMADMLLFALDNEQAIGPMNGTAPNPVTNKEMSRALGKVLHRPSFMPAPGFALRLMFGEVGSMITKGQRVIPKRALEMGFTFAFPHIEDALRDCLA